MGKRQTVPGVQQRQEPDVVVPAGKNADVCNLTERGYDDMKSGQAIVSTTGTVIVQDEATSVVWGMPRSVAMVGVGRVMLSLPEIAPYVQKLMTKRS